MNKLQIVDREDREAVGTINMRKKTRMAIASATVLISEHAIDQGSQVLKLVDEQLEKELNHEVYGDIKNLIRELKVEIGLHYLMSFDPALAKRIYDILDRMDKAANIRRE